MSDPVIPDPQTPLAKPTASAKEISKWSMVVAALWIGILSLVKAFWPLIAKPVMLATGEVRASTFGLDMGDIIFSGLALAAVFTPIYFSIVLDKIRDMKLGGK